MNSPNSSNIIQNVKFSDSSEIFGYVQLNVLAEPLEVSVDRGCWQETSRWIKYQEDLEKYSGRWSRPHIASISFNSLLQLKELIESDGILVLNVDGYDMGTIAQALCTELVDKGHLGGEEAGNLKSILLLKHKNVPATSEWNFSGLKKHQPSIENLRMLNFSESRRNSLPESVIAYRISTHSDDQDHEIAVQNPLLKDEELLNKHELNKLLSPISDMNGLRTICTKLSISENQSVNSTLIMVGLKMPGITKPIFVFLRMSEPLNLPNITEFPIPVGVIVFIFTPSLTEEIENHTDFIELGRSFGCLMSNRAFFDRAQTARDKKQLLMGFKLFLKESLILTPPTTIDDFDENLLPAHILKTKLELIQWKYKRNSILSFDKQKLVAFMTPNVSFFTNSEKGIEGEMNGGLDINFESVIEDPFTRTNRPFGGAINDLKRRFPHFKTDFTDSLNLQCVATIVFIYFAALSHVITFGALLGTKTNNMIGISETLVSSFLSGTIFTLFSCQPLLPINPTGALLLFDELLYNYSVRHSLDFLTIRVWISLWAFGISCFVVCLEGSVYAKKFSRFTQEIFATFISLIFTFESLHSLMQIFEDHPLTSIEISFERHNLLRNVSEIALKGASDISTNELKFHQPNTALFSMFLMFGTFLLAYFLHEFKYSIFLGEKVRRILGDFGVPIAIGCMISIDYCSSVNTFTPKIQVPPGIQPSSPQLRGWFISPGGSVGENFPIWLIFASAVPALLVFFLVFITLEICELLVNKKEFKLRKGSGLHWDLIVVSLVNVMNAFLGAPWVCVATLKALSHVSSLMVFSNTNAPGEKPVVLKVIEQRVTGLCVNLLIGCSILLAPLLSYIPIPVLLGVFLYMGITSFKITQLFARFKLLFIPSKNHPHNCNYVRNVKTSKMHLYTVVQVLVLVILWGIKSTKEISLGFPFFLMCLVPIRHMLARFFTQNELEALDSES